VLARLTQIYLNPAKQNVSEETFIADVETVLTGLARDGAIGRIVASMPARMQAVIAAQGGPTGY